MTSGAWTATGKLSVGRISPVAALLEDGTVLMIGGGNLYGSVPDVDLYDPVAAAWRRAPSMTQARDGHTATPLGGGAVLVTGGTGEGGIRASAELYRY